MDLTLVQEPEVHSLAVLEYLQPWRKRLVDHFGTVHGNASLKLMDVLIVMLAGFFNPLIRSQRLLEALSSQKWIQEKTGLARIPRSTLSDGFQRFDPELLRPLIRELSLSVPALGQKDPDLAGISRAVLAADGSYFTLAGEVAWALMNPTGAKTCSKVRWNLQLDTATWLPVEADISGQDDGNEAEAFRRRIQGGVIYLVDRNFVNFGFIQAVLDAGSNLVLRLKKNVGFSVQGTLPLGARDKELGVVSDEVGVLSGPASKSNEGRKSRTAKPPAQVLRRVAVYDPAQRETVVLLTDMLDVPAYVIALLYRRRWQIELFFRWLKCWARMDHLIAQCPQGITLQFYVAVIATLLLYLASGRRVNKYALFWLGSVASGLATFEEMQEGLARIEREKALERARRARKKLPAPALPA
jgi:hypothetical protein